MYGLEQTDDVDVLWARVRHEREKELAACDWTQVADAPVDKTAWAKYRQELRDLPAKYDDPSKIIWPVKPA